MMRLALADGTVWAGAPCGAPGTRFGEAVFYTGWTGYQEVLTDPSYAGQIVVMTAPQVGNTGVVAADHESGRAWLSGFVVREMSRRVSNWQASADLPSWLAGEGVPALTGADTRALTRRLRDGGTMKAVVSDDASLSEADLVQAAREWPGLDGVDLVSGVTCAAEYRWTEGTPAEWSFGGPPAARPLHVVVYDFGVKRNILRRLVSKGCTVTVVPARTPAEAVLARHPDGVLLSNGPGDPAAVPYAVEAARRLMGKVPLFGICLGHQILGQALGGRTFRLPFGHHGGNQPVRCALGDRVEISSHNHNFAVDPASLPSGVEVTHVNLNDGCCEGLRHPGLGVVSLQYHPEAAPGPHDSDAFFDEFVEAMARRASLAAAG